jgi:hypothetical protein
VFGPARQVRLDHKAPRQNGSITFQTTGILLRKIIGASVRRPALPTIVKPVKTECRDPVKRVRLETPIG